MDEKEYIVTNIKKTTHASDSETYEVTIKRKGEKRSKPPMPPVTHKWDSVLPMGLLFVLWYWFITSLSFPVEGIDVMGIICVIWWFSSMRVSYLEEKKRTSYIKLQAIINFLTLLFLVAWLIYNF